VCKRFYSAQNNYDCSSYYICRKKLLKAEIDKDPPPNNSGTFLALLSIENDMPSTLDYSEMFGLISSRKSRENIFRLSKNFIHTSNLPDCRFITFNDCGYTAFQRSAF
jgi:hypothetical protein